MPMTHGKRNLSKAARANIAKAQRERWTKYKAAKAEASNGIAHAVASEAEALSDELQIANAIFKLLKLNYLTPAGWTCGDRMSHVVLSVYAVLHRD